MTELSVLIPSRNELFLNNTIVDIFEHAELDTEVIVVLDGSWPIEPIPDHPRLTLIHHSVSIGQRAAVNEAARLSKAKYVMKLDAHCAVGQGFDRIMLEDMQDDWTMVPKMYNLHAFDWVCKTCKERRYQGPSGPCEKCGGETHRDVLWRTKSNPETTAMRFDANLKFQYWGDYKKRQKGDLVETMSLIGACWLLTRERYWELGVCDEGHGGWGQQGTEISCKAWLSGGRLICNKRTSFTHMFRTQGKGFGFPYPISGSDVRKAREYSHKLWLENNWDKAIHPLSWLIERFAPIPDWHDESGAEVLARVTEAGATFSTSPSVTPNAEPVKECIYYSDNRLDPIIERACQQQLLKAGLPIISVSLKPIDFGRNIVLNAERSVLSMFRQILMGLEASTADVVFLTEYDCLYHPSHFDFTPPDRSKVYYNLNAWLVRASDGHALFYRAKRTSQLCAYREVLLEHYRKRVKLVEEVGFSRRMGFEPASHRRKERVDDLESATWRSPVPNIDIKHGKNLTPARWRQDQFRSKRSCREWTEADEVPGWGAFLEILNV